MQQMLPSPPDRPDEPDFSLDGVRALLREIATLSVPSLRTVEEVAPGQRQARWVHPQQQIERLEAHMLDCAIARQRLEEAALFLREATRELEDQWDEIEGWEMMRKGDTQKAAVEAKRKLKPDLYHGIRSGKGLVDQLYKQIKRLERDEEAVSRAYTMLGAG